ncbi:kinase-like domain-containing protein [Radiomyces spectabilis]|uniref:kinase-like domain-containing protein n=1 Tax=Radiomyces spectabilis TaxID=64574 RepID=UPI0022200F3C|nr:kinase-like domain-containing protein [Radiomyces spectabilis]KAI8380920.1 kinase-like domain-containing protein [Radiomyces spectabilis]
MKSTAECTDDSESNYSDVVSIHSDDEEDLEDYRKGGYHPVCIGDRFNHDRYIVVRKLGWGHFSTVWLAQDTKTHQHVALKIVKAASHFTQSALDEVKLLEKVNRANPENAGWQYIAQLLDHFWHTGPNGKHVCMTFEVLGESLLSLIKRFNYRGIPTPIVKRISRQILLGLDYLHRECGIVHTDLKPENVLVWIPNVEEYLQKITNDSLHHMPPFNENMTTPSNHATATTETTESNETDEPVTEVPPVSVLSTVDTTGMTKNQKKKLKKKLKKKQAEATGTTTTSGNKKSSTSTAIGASDISNGLANLSLSESDGFKIIPSSILDFTSILSDGSKDDDLKAFDKITVKIADFGNACWLDGDYTHIIQTRQYRSPEVIVGAKWTDRADIWSMACMVFELLTGEFLFDPRAGSKYNKDDDHLAQVIELMRVVPRSLTMGGEYSSEFFNRNGELRHIKKLRYRRLRDVLHDSFLVPPAEADLLSSFLSPMLEVDADKRITAHEVLNHPWLNEE